MEAQAVLDEMDTNHREKLHEDVPDLLCSLCEQFPQARVLTFPVIKTSHGCLSKIFSLCRTPKALLHPGLKCLQGTLGMKTSRGLLPMKPN